MEIERICSGLSTREFFPQMKYAFFMQNNVPVRIPNRILIGVLYGTGNVV